MQRKFNYSKKLFRKMNNHDLYPSQLVSIFNAAPCFCPINITSKCFNNTFFRRCPVFINPFAPNVTWRYCTVCHACHFGGVKLHFNKNYSNRGNARWSSWHTKIGPRAKFHKVAWNEQDTSHKLYTWHISVAGNHTLVSIILSWTLYLLRLNTNPTKNKLVALYWKK